MPQTSVYGSTTRSTASKLDTLGQPTASADFNFHLKL